MEVSWNKEKRLKLLKIRTMEEIYHRAKTKTSEKEPLLSRD